MTTPQSTTSQYRSQAAIAASAASVVGSLWGRVGDDFDAGWAAIRPQTVAVIERARQATVATALPYTEAVLAETRLDAPPVARLNLQGFLATGTDGQPVGSMLDAAPIRAKQAMAAGASSSQALAAAETWLTATTLTMMADTRRQVYAADIVTRPAVTGYVRMLTPPSCSRCVILAGKWFRWNEGFQRHPRCDCTHIPSTEDVAGDFTTDPYEYFRSLSAEQQDKVFGRSNARAVRSGADIYRVVNVQTRGLAGARGAHVYGAPSRMTPDDILRIAGTRTNAIRLLEREGYITGPQVRGGNIVGAYRESFTAPISRAVVAGSNRDRVLTARATGVRDPLDRTLMTSEERRLYDAWYKLDRARMTGRIPLSVTNTRGLRGSDADRFASALPASAADIARLERELEAQVALVKRRLANNEFVPPSVLRVARALGLL